MDKEMLEALQASIVKWEENTKVISTEEAKIWGDTCPLCEISSRRMTYEMESPCEACLVYERTGQVECGGSPWYSTLFYWRAVADGTRPLSDFHSAAQKEVDFLISLLPEDKS